MLTRNEHDRLAARFYAAAAGDDDWGEALGALATAFRAAVAMMVVGDPTRSRAFLTYPFSEDFSGSFMSGEVFGNDPRVPMFFGAKPGTIYYDAAMFDVEAMNRDPRCVATNEALGTKYSLGARIDLPGGMSGTVGLLHAEAEGHASPETIAAFRRLAPHLRNAISLARIVDGQAATRDILFDALARRADGVILLDHAGAPGFMNDTARAILAAGDGLGYKRGAFVARRGPETRKLQRMIGEAVAIRSPSERARTGHEVLIPRPSGKRPYVVRAMPAPRTDRFLARMSIAGVVHIHDTAAVRVPPRRLLQAAFGLSEREADLAVALFVCAGLAGAADECSMSVNTARVHLRAIFQKTATAGQVELVQLLSRFC